MKNSDLETTRQAILILFMGGFSVRKIARFTGIDFDICEKLLREGIAIGKN